MYSENAAGQTWSMILRKVISPGSFRISKSLQNFGHPRIFGSGSGVAKEQRVKEVCEHR